MTNPHQPSSRQHLVGPPFLGSVLLIAGGLLAGLRLAQDAAGLPFAMPGFWYVNRAMWYAVALALGAAGIGLLRERAPDITRWRPTRAGVRFRRVVLYTRPGCALCEEAADVLQQHRPWLPPVEEETIDGDAELVERFGTCVPVVEMDGRVRFRGRVNEVLLRRLIEGSPPVDRREMREPV